MTGVTERISVSATGGDANGNSFPIGITPDGGASTS